MLPTLWASFQRLRSLAACVVPCNDPELLWESSEEPLLWALLGQQPLGAAATGKGENWVLFLQLRAQAEDSVQALQKGWNCFLRPLPARGMPFIGTALRSTPVPALLLPPHLKSHKPPESSVSGGGIQARPNHKP